MLSRFLAGPDRAPVANGSCSEQDDIAEAVRRAFGRASSWRIPPHWSRRDWLDEVRAILHSGAVCAGSKYNEERGVPLRAYIYIWAVAAAWTRYRQEWSYYLHCVVESGTDVELIAMPLDQDHLDAGHFLSQALSRLSVEDHRLIQKLFWDNTEQHRVAATLQISQQCVSRRKLRVLRQLRRLLKVQSKLFFRVITLCWTSLNALDLLPAIDLL